MPETLADGFFLCVMFFMTFVEPGMFVFGGPLSFLRRGIAALKQYFSLRKQPEENAGSCKYLWKGIAFAVLGTLGIGAVVFLLAGSVMTGLILMIVYFVAAGPSLLFWGVVLLCLFLRERRKPERSGKTERYGWLALAYLAIGLAGTVVFIGLKYGGPLGL